MTSGVTLRAAGGIQAKLALILSFLSKFIHECIEGDKTLLKQNFTSPKALLYQMYMVINRLDETKLYKMDFLINFGVPFDAINQIAAVLEDGSTYEDIKAETFNKLPFLQILKLYLYFSWGDKKLHQVIYIENKDDISEDLLNDFKDPDSRSKLKQPAVLSKANIKEKTQEKAVIKVEEKMISEHEYLFGMKKKEDDSKAIDVSSSKHFPTLIGGGGGEETTGGPLWSAPGGQKQKVGQKSFGKKALATQNKISESDWGAGKNPFEEKKSREPAQATEAIFGKK